MIYVGIISNGPSAAATAPRLAGADRPQVLIGVNHQVEVYACDWWVTVDWWTFANSEPLLYEGRKPTVLCRRDWLREMDAAALPRWHDWPKFYLEDIDPAIPPPDSPDVPLMKHRHGNDLGIVRWDGFSGRAALGLAWWLCRREQFSPAGNRSLDIVLAGYDNSGNNGARDHDASRANRTPGRWGDEQRVFDYFLRAFERIGVGVERLME